MKRYIDQIFNEGLGYSLYLPIERVLLKIKSIKLRNICVYLYKIIYFVIAIIIAIIILIKKL